MQKKKERKRNFAKIYFANFRGYLIINVYMYDLLLNRRERSSCVLFEP